MYFYLEGNCLVVLYWFLDYKIMKQPCVYVHAFLLELPPFHPIHPAELATSSPARGGVHRAVLFSAFVPPCPSPLCPYIYPLRLCLSSCPPNRFISSIFLDSIMCVNM